LSFTMSALGWSPSREAEFEQHAAGGLSPARVAAQHRGGYVVYTECGERPAEVAGRLRHVAATAANLPAVGDWVAVEDGPSAAAATIHDVLERSTVFSRKTAGEEAAEQVVAANVDVVFLVSAFGEDLNVRRIERYLASGWESGAQPVIVLNKSDLADDLAGAGAVAEVEAVAFGVPVHVISCLDGAGMDELEPYFSGNRTVALLGSSGVGKSSLLNRLLGWERQDVQTLRGDGKGRHTTTYRELVPLATGGLVLDTPGMRELGLWSAEAGVDETFSDLAELAAGCRFTDCAHESEPGCAVRAAIVDGRLAQERLSSYRKLQRELERLELKTDPRARAEVRRRRRRFARSLRKSAY
jgi:ribosome biogenesis GTPase